MPAAALEIAGLGAGYGQTRVLEAIDLAVPAGQRLAVLGRNGVGKTTLLASIAGQTRRHAGTIRLGDIALTELGGAQRARAGLGYVPQGRAIFRSLSVEENLVVGLRDRPRAALAEAYEMFPALAARRRHFGGQLSGGEQQMLAIARTLLGRPRLLLLDEPLEGLAPRLSAEVMTVLGRLAASGETTIVLVEQRLRAALGFAERVVILERGRIAWTGTPAELAASPETVDRLLGVGALGG